MFYYKTHRAKQAQKEVIYDLSSEIMYYPKPVGNEKLRPVHLRKYLGVVSAVLCVLG